MQRPMRDLLVRVSRRTSLHMPAAQGRAPFARFNAYRLDTTELPVTDDLYRPTGAIAEAERLIARSTGAMATMLLHDGSTAGVHAMMLYACKRGDAIVLPRNAHLSCLSLCATAGLTPMFAEPSFTPDGRLYTTPDAYARTLDAHPEATAALALSTDYYGLVSDVRGIAREVHARGRLLLCDEAHGAYFNWREDIPNAGACGADLFVQSAHKTLPALTPGAWLHAMDGIDAERLRAILRMVQTSSPSFLMMLSLDDARAWMDLHGEVACQRLLTALPRFREQAARLGFADGQAVPPEGMRYDRLRLVLHAPQGGEWLQGALQARGIDVEMADEGHVVCILSLIDGKARLRQLRKTLRAIAHKAERCPVNPPAILKRDDLSNPLRPESWPPRRLPIGEAAFAPCEPLSPTAAIGRVSAANVGLYPPGVAWLTAGDEVTSEIAAIIAGTNPDRLFGLDGQHRLRCVRLSQ